MTLLRAIALIFAPLGLLGACDRPGHGTGAAAPADASSAASVAAMPEAPVVDLCVPPNQPTAAGAADDRPESLMREAFPGWMPKQGCLLIPADDDPNDAGERPRLIQPDVVMSFGEDRRVLIVSGEPSDERGTAMGAHAEPGNLAAYGFTRRDGRWFKTHATPSIAEIGYSGNPGNVQVVELATGQPGLLVSNGSCWQGYCGGWLHWFELDADGVLLRSGDFDMLVSSSLGGGPEGCEAWLSSARGRSAKGDPVAASAALAAVPGPARPASAPEGVDAENCFDVHGTVRLVPVAGQTWSDIVIDYEGAETIIDAATKAPAPRAIRETAVWRRQGEAYELVQGRNPTHGF